MHVKDCNQSVRSVTDKPAALPLVHRWILSRTARAIDAVRSGLDEYHFNLVASAIYQFTWHELCDWYVEWIKGELYGEDEELRQQARGVLLVALETMLKLIHPITPFVTEEIWSVLPGERTVLMLERFPQREDEWCDHTAESEMEVIMGIITGIRNIRAEAEVHPSQKIEAFVDNISDEQAQLVGSFSSVIVHMTRLTNLVVQPGSQKPDDAATYLYNDIEIYVPLTGLIDLESELEKLARERRNLEKSLKQVNGKLANQKFLAKAPEAVVTKEKAKKDELDGRLTRIAESERRLAAIVDR
jgi:valyl-tRNA synthetase